MSNHWFYVGTIHDFPENECVYQENTPFGEIIIIQQKKQLHALRGICTHEEFELEDCPVQEGQITCPLHFSAFDLKTGEALNEPAETPLEVFKIKIEEEGVWITRK